MSPRRRLRKALTFAAIGVPAVMSWTVVQAQSKPEVIFNEFTFHRDSPSQGWGDKLVEFHQSKEARMIADAVATYFGVSTDNADAIVQVGQKIVAEVSKRDGEEEIGIFRAPDGYTTCKAELLQYETKEQPNHLVTFNTRVIRTVKEDGIGYYLVVPRSLDEGTWLHARIRLTYVIADPQRVVDWTKTGRCQTNNVCPWQNYGDGKRFNVGPPCVPSDTRGDRWPNGVYPGGVRWPPGPND